MTLDEAFKLYDDSVKLKRKVKNRDGCTIKFLKGLKAWGNQESRDLGFIIPQFMIDDANANDWDVYEQTIEPHL